MLSLKSSEELAGELAQRLRERRLRRGWTQAELAARAGIATPTYVHFERTGRVALERLIKVLEVLDLLPEFERLGAGEDLAGLNMAQVVAPKRQRGRRRRTAR